MWNLIFNALTTFAQPLYLICLYKLSWDAIVTGGFEKAPISVSKLSMSNPGSESIYKVDHATYPECRLDSARNIDQSESLESVRLCAGWL